MHRYPHYIDSKVIKAGTKLILWQFGDYMYQLDFGDHQINLLDESYEDALEKFNQYNQQVS